MIGLALFATGGVLIHRGYMLPGALAVGVSMWIGIIWAVAQVAT